MRANKVHMGLIRVRTLCGTNHGLNSWKIVPLSREWRDVTCKHCLKAKPKVRVKR